MRLWYQRKTKQNLRIFPTPGSTFSNVSSTPLPCSRHTRSDKLWKGILWDTRDNLSTRDTMKPKYPLFRGSPCYTNVLYIISIHDSLYRRGSGQDYSTRPRISRRTWEHWRRNSSQTDHSATPPPSHRLCPTSRPWGISSELWRQRRILSGGDSVFSRSSSRLVIHFKQWRRLYTAIAFITLIGPSIVS